MKVASIATFLGKTLSGAAVSAYFVTEGVAKKTDVVAYSAKFSGRMPFKVRSLGMGKVPDNMLFIGNPLTNWLMYRRLLKFFRADRPDVVHIQEFSALDPALRAAKKLGIPTVMTVRDYRFHCNLSIDLEQNRIQRNYTRSQYWEWLKESAENRYGTWLPAIGLFPLIWPMNKRHRKNVKQVDRVITVSDFVKKQLIKEGVPKEKVQTIKVPKPDWKYTPPKRKRHVQIFAGGVLAKPKGFQLLIKALLDVVKVVPGIKVNIAGTGSYKQQLEQMVRDFRLKDNVRFLGKINYREMRRQYQDADIVVLPSLWPEPLSRIIFETFSVGRPIVATDTGGSSELVQDGKTGYVVDWKRPREMARRIIKLAKDRDLREKMGKAANQLVEQEAAPSIVAERHITQYRQAFLTATERLRVNFIEHERKDAIGNITKRIMGILSEKADIRRTKLEMVGREKGFGKVAALMKNIWTTCRALSSRSVIHFDDPKQLEPFLNILFRNKRSVLTVYHLDDEPIAFQRLFPFLTWRRLFNSFSEIITISETSRDQLIKGYGVPREKITLAHPGVDRSLFRRNLPRPRDLPKRYILYLGSEIPRKNIPNMLSAFKIISDKIGGIKLVKAGYSGGKEHRKETERLVRELGLKEKVVFTPYLKEEDIPKLYAHAEVFLYPTLIEGFGMPIIEALACGCPVVTSNRPPMSRLGKDQILVDPRDPLKIAAGIATALKRGKSLTESTEKRLMTYDWDENASRTLSVYTRAAKYK